MRAVAQCEGDSSIPWASLPVFIQVIGQTTTSGTTDVDPAGERRAAHDRAGARRHRAGRAEGQERKSARGLKRTCTRRSSGSILAVVCSASWTDKKKYRYNGLWRMALNDDGTISATFNGRRALTSCVKKGQAKKQVREGVLQEAQASTMTVD